MTIPVPLPSCWSTKLCFPRSAVCSLWQLSAVLVAGTLHAYDLRLTSQGVPRQALMASLMKRSIQLPSNDMQCDFICPDRCIPCWPSTCSCRALRCLEGAGPGRGSQGWWAHALRGLHRQAAACAASALRCPHCCACCPAHCFLPPTSHHLQAGASRCHFLASTTSSHAWYRYLKR